MAVASRPAAFHIAEPLGPRLLHNTVAVATPAGFEPATTRLEGECSIQLSYGVVRGCLGRHDRLNRGPDHSGNCRHSFSAFR